MNTIFEHTDIVTCLEVMKDNNLMFTGCNDGYVRLYSIQNLEQ